jgi:hypothetical protein
MFCCPAGPCLSGQLRCPCCWLRSTWCSPHADLKWYTCVKAKWGEAEAKSHMWSAPKNSMSVSVMGSSWMGTYNCKFLTFLTKPTAGASQYCLFLEEPVVTCKMGYNVPMPSRRLHEWLAQPETSTLVDGVRRYYYGVQLWRTEAQAQRMAGWMQQRAAAAPAAPQQAAVAPVIVIDSTDEDEDSTDEDEDEDEDQD